MPSIQSMTLTHWWFDHVPFNFDAKPFLIDMGEEWVQAFWWAITEGPWMKVQADQREFFWCFEYKLLTVSIVVCCVASSHRTCATHKLRCRNLSLSNLHPWYKLISCVCSIAMLHRIAQRWGWEVWWQMLRGWCVLSWNGSSRCLCCFV